MPQSSPICVRASKSALKQFFAKCAFLVLFDSLFHTAGDDVLIEIIGLE